MKREWLLVVITVGIGIDWFPFLLTGYFPQLAPLSGTRFVVIPGLALAFLRRPSWLTKPHVIGFAYLAHPPDRGRVGMVGRHGLDRDA